MHSVLENDTDTVNNGKLISEAINQGISSFTPDLMFEKLVSNYSLAEQLFGPKLIRHLSGYDPNYIERNINIPEFQRELKKKIEDNINSLKQDKLIDKQGIIQDKGTELATLTLYMEELDNIIPKGTFGEHSHKKHYIYGSKQDARVFKKGDRYKDIALKRSVKTAIRRNHTQLHQEDLKVYEKESRGKVYVIYAMDASGSMKGNKIKTSKKAGIALSYKAIDNKDKVGLIVFGSEIKTKVYPTSDFARLIKEITKIRASMETDIVNTIKESIEMFPQIDTTKHLILLSDALPTVGEDPERETLEAVGIARDNGITISVIGINLDKKGKNLAKQIVEISLGRLYLVKDLENLDKVILEDYSELS